ncbi:hypothetical protein RB653_005998 [Dictyostelium firmibasis]|uniref:Counting factor associated protein D n=1 Tax=Dictyostelium firmibasis TaxID=79012 RepID=A0AAN7U918_9MYCE
MNKFILLLSLVTLSCVLAIPQLPTDQQYYMKGSFNIPYFNIVEPIELIYDSVNNRQYISYYNGMDITINFYNQDNTYNVGPVKYDMVCTTTPGNGSLVNVLPTEPSSWVYNGTSTVNGVSVYGYSQKVTEYGRTGFYNFFVDENGVPVQFYMDGVDYVFGSHPDVYVLNFDVYSTDISSYESLFTVPTICNDAQEAPAQENEFSGIFSIADNLKTKEEKASKLFNEYKAEYNKEYSSQDEHDERFINFKSARKTIAVHNAKKSSYKLGMNHYADLSNKEFNTLIKPKVARPLVNGAEYIHDDESTTAIPSTVDWRIQGCVTPVKDQGVCGSCWTFGSTGSLEGTNCVTNGELVSLSEQQLVDCAILTGSQGCGGGFASSAFEYIMQAPNGIATEDSYPYLMQNGLCQDRNNTPSGVTITGYVNVTSGSEAALVNAIATAGPVAIAIDASVDDFRYYISGVYNNPACQNGLDDLDHEVLAIGYGTYQGQDYFLVKNSWSTNWGQNGYVFMARNDNNLCGVATSPNYPIPTKN